MLEEERRHQWLAAHAASQASSPIQPQMSKHSFQLSPERTPSRTPSGFSPIAAQVPADCMEACVQHQEPCVYISSSYMRF